MNIFKQLKINIIKIIYGLAKDHNIYINDILFSYLTIKLTHKQLYGEICTNAALVFAKAFSYTEKQIGQLIVERLKYTNYIETTNLASRGFINITLKAFIWTKAINNILLQPHNTYTENTKNKQEITLECNVIHAALLKGYNRGLIFVNALNALFIKSGYKVTKQYLQGSNYLNSTVTIYKSNIHTLDVINISNHIIYDNNLNYISLNDIILTFFSKKHTLPLKIQTRQIYEQSKSNIIFCIKYTYNLVCYILEHAKNNTLVDYIGKLCIDCNHYTQDDLELIKLLALWPQILEDIITSYEIHQIALYLQKLSMYFYNTQHKESNKNLPFIYNNDINLTVTRLALIRAIKVVIESGFDIIGIKLVVKN
ncbi:MAG: DALR anticodon-binding domain-containing protein [Rickettsiales endosymbiont of Dermacentor nuttalli]